MELILDRNTCAAIGTELTEIGLSAETVAQFTAWFVFSPHARAPPPGRDLPARALAEESACWVPCVSRLACDFSSRRTP